MATFYPLHIKDIIQETEDAVSITFTIPDALKNVFTFIAGQYITIKTTLKNQEVRRAYSICSSPNSGEITVAVKRIEGGNFSVYATTELKKGTTMDVSPPEGKFILESASENNKNYLAFTAGSGVTPIMAMIKDVLETEKNSTFTVVFGNKSAKSALFYNALNLLQKEHPTSFFMTHLFSQEKVDNALFGRIDASVVNTIMEKNEAFSDVFLCGPEEMILTVKDTLEQKGFPENKIHFELFTKKESSSENTALDGESEITILLDDETTTFKMQQNDNILKAALAKDLDAPYSCQGGICSSCLAKITEGKAIMKSNSILSKEEVEEGYILTCEAHPTTAKITIDYDI